MTSGEGRSTRVAARSFARGNRGSIARTRGWQSGAAVVVLGLTFALAGPRPAEAQFICVGNPTGALVPPATADGQGATGTAASSVACGPGAVATGADTTAVGSTAGSG